MSDLVWVFLEGKSAKVWGYDLFSGEGGHTVHYYWGSIGRPMQALTKKTVKYPTFHEAHDAVMEKIKDKEWKGYKRIRNGLYFQAIEDFLDILRENTTVSPLFNT